MRNCKIQRSCFVFPVFVLGRPGFIWKSAAENEKHNNYAFHTIATLS